MAKRLCLVDDLKMLKITMSNTSSRNKLNPEINDHYNILTGECQKDELKTKDKAFQDLLSRETFQEMAQIRSLSVKERTTKPTKMAITEVTGGLNIQRLIIERKIISVYKRIKRYLHNFNQYLVDELADVQNVFYQMEQAVEQHRLESRTFEVKMNQVLSENERLLAQAIDHDIVKTIVNLSVNDGCETIE
ncbi:hypothetical protein Tco_1101750 [Tanacetum coccineum]